ncbi:MAG: hypothetical protein KN64_01745 [Sulfurovum sp. AS07-7]|nr:MAG: hypothetical protein KN64_01745 [Sulfurovum sp. AS07-7]
MTNQDKLKKFGWITISASVVFIVIYLYYFGYPAKPIGLLKLTGWLSLFSAALFYLVNNHLWKMKWISSLFGSIPNINGNWSVVIINIADGKEQNANIKITQTWLNIHVITKVERGNSSTISSEIVKINETWKLYFVWNASFDGEAFDGTTVVTIFDDELDGYYFTNSKFGGKNCTAGSFKAIRKGHSR